jgi:perosamine synthetase
VKSIEVLHPFQPWIGEEEKKAIAEYLDSGGWLTEFEKTSKFEEMLAAYVGSSHAIAVSNGTVSLYAALRALGIGPGDEIIVPDFTMIASANAVVLTGATPVFVDISSANLCLDLDLAERAISGRTRAIMLVSLNGRAPDMQRAVSLAARYELFLMEDAAQSLGSRQAGRHLGTFGRVGSFSFSPAKIVTMGQGGALVTNDGKVAERIRQIKDFGRRTAGADYHEIIGFNFKLTDLQAVIGIEQMKKLEYRVKRKKEIFAGYREQLAGIPGLQMIDTDLAESTPWVVDILVDEPEKLGLYLEQQGVRTRRFYPPVHSQPAYGLTCSFPISASVCSRGLWLPSSSFLTEADVSRVCDAVRCFFCGGD